MRHLRKAIQRLIRRLEAKSARETTPARVLPSEITTRIKRLPETHQIAARKLVSHQTVGNLDYLKKVVKTSREGSHPHIVEFYLQFNKALMQRGYPFYAFEFLRDQKRQATLFKQGVSYADAGQSPHNIGCAVDIVHTQRFWDLTEKEWTVIGAIGHEVARKRKIPVVWGGDWDGDGDIYDNRLFDPAHWELAYWRDLKPFVGSLANSDDAMSRQDFVELEYHALNAGAKWVGRNLKDDF